MRAHKRLIQQLQQQGIKNSAVLEVMQSIPRHIFIDEALSDHAYANHPMPIGYGQTISQPYIVARMTEELLNQGMIDNVLEIGSGCGYQTAILASLVRKVYSVERIKELTNKARKNIMALNLNNVQFYHDDGHWGWPEHAPYPGIIVTAAPISVPEALLKQLAIGGCLIIPTGPKGQQVLLKIVRTRDGYERSTLDDVSFVPLCEGIS
ncbi:protein-L-isoaspartate(D-aspartate) O-methyltransferase [Candidatus Halobeggiatoa sp. HSG11]|nr:protein-L-isoaspartate(D-aspartate) O-methyltransferase [Candidatus Halobeggiatoa sp. HSG11]